MAGKMSINNIEDQYVRENIAVLLENQEAIDKKSKLLTETSQGSNTTTVSQTHAGLDGAFSPIALALVRRTFPELFANKIVGVQSMAGPVGLAYALRVYYKGSTDYNESAFDKVPEYSGFTGSLSGTSGTVDVGTGVSTSAGEAFTFGDDMPELQLKIDKVAIEAKTRKLGASYSLEDAQDIKAMHGVDIEREMVNQLQYEIQAELDRELLYKVKSVATTTTTFDISATDGRWHQERIAGLVNRIVSDCNNIATRTRRGSGNFIVVSTAVASALQSLQGGLFTANPAMVNPTNTYAEIGTLQGIIKVYRDTYNTTNSILSGYKGPGVSDCGVIYSPYIMGLFNRAIAQEDFSPRIGVMSRYAITENLLGASRYYSNFAVSNIAYLLQT
jgi:hypothetical protein